MRNASPAKDSVSLQPARTPQATDASPDKDSASSRPSSQPQMRNASPAKDSASSRPSSKPQVREVYPAEVSTDRPSCLLSMPSRDAPPADATASTSRHAQAITVSLPRYANSSGSSPRSTIMVDLIGIGDIEVYEVHAHSDHTILDVKELFERIKEHDLYVVKDMEATQNGIILSNSTLITELNSSTSISVVVKSTLQALDICTTYSYQDVCQENMSMWSDDASALHPYSENAPDNSMIWADSIDWGFADSMLDFGVYLENHETSHTITKGDCQEKLDVLASIAENTSVIAAEPLLEQVADPTSVPLHTRSGRLLLPENFSDQNLLQIEIHGFKSSYELRSKINDGEVSWISKQKALGLLCNPSIFSVDEVREDQKADGLVCVINSTRCSLPETVLGYKIKCHEESKETHFNPMKHNGVKLNWSEVRGHQWIRRRLSLHGDATGFEVIQWRKYPTRKKVAAQNENQQAVAGLPTEGEEGGASSSSSSLAQSITQLLSQQAMLLDGVSAQQRLCNDIIARLDRAEAAQTMLLDHVSAQQKVNDDIVSRLDKLEKMLRGQQHS